MNANPGPGPANTRSSNTTAANQGLICGFPSSRGTRRPALLWSADDAICPICVDLGTRHSGQAGYRGRKGRSGAVISST